MTRRPFLSFAILLLASVGQGVAQEPAAKDADAPFPLGGVSSPASKRSFQVYDNYDLSRASAKRVEAADVTACSAACQDDVACVTFSYDKWKHTCLISPETGLFRFEPSAASGVLLGTTQPVESAAPFAMQCTADYALRGEILAPAIASSAGECAQKCVDQAECVGFNFVKIGAACALLREGAAFSTDASSIAGVKRQVGAEGAAASNRFDCLSPPAGATAAVSPQTQAAEPNEAVGENSPLVQHQRCLLATFIDKLKTTREVDSGLIKKSLQSCEKTLRPLKNLIVARTHDKVLAERMAASIRAASTRGLTVSLMGYYAKGRS